MAQLSEDCFAFGGALLTYERALAALRAAAAQMPLSRTQTLPLAHLPGRILAQSVLAERSVPPFENSAVDGYAYTHTAAHAATHAATGDGAASRDFTLVATPIVAGQRDPAPLTAGQAVRILTGAPVPAGADTILMEEDAQISGETLRVPTALKRGANLRREGEDIRAGQTLYPAGHCLSALDCARLAAGGVTAAAVAAPLSIALLSSGDEIKSGQVIDANRWVLQAVFSGPAFAVHYGGVVGDDLAETRAALRGLRADLIVTSGGVSVGERDVLRLALEAEGSLDFWRVGIKPGRPVAFGTLGKTPFFGLPGNPVACFVTAQFLARPFALARLGVAPDQGWLEVTMAKDYKKKSGRTEFVRVHVDADQRARPYAVAGAGILSSLTQCDGVVRLDEAQTRIEAGTRVPYLPFKGLL